MKKANNNDVVEESIQHAERLTAGDPGMEGALTEARARVEALRATARHIVSPSQLSCVEEAVLTDFQMAIDAAALAPFEPIAPALLELHAACIDAYSSLAAVARGLRGLRLVRSHARRGAEPEPELRDRAASLAADQFVVAISRQLSDRGMLLPESALLSGGIPALERRIAAVEQRHAETVAARARAAEDAAGIEAAEAAATAAREAATHNAVRLLEQTPDQRKVRAELVDFYRRQGTWQFPVDGRWVSAAEIAEALEAGAEFLPLYRIQNQGRPAPRQTATMHAS